MNKNWPAICFPWKSGICSYRRTFPVRSFSYTIPPKWILDSHHSFFQIKMKASTGSGSCLALWCWNRIHPNPSKSNPSKVEATKSAPEVYGPIPKLEECQKPSDNGLLQLWYAMVTNHLNGPFSCVKCQQDFGPSLCSCVGWCPQLNSHCSHCGCAMVMADESSIAINSSHFCGWNKFQNCDGYTAMPCCKLT